MHDCPPRLERAQVACTSRANLRYPSTQSCWTASTASQDITLGRLPSGRALRSHSRSRGTNTAPVHLLGAQSTTSSQPTRGSSSRSRFVPVSLLCPDKESCGMRGWLPLVAANRPSWRLAATLLMVFQTRAEVRWLESCGYDAGCRPFSVFASLAAAHALPSTLPRRADHACARPTKADPAPGGGVARGLGDSGLDRIQV